MQILTKRTDCMHCRPSIWVGPKESTFCDDNCFQAFLVSWSLQAENPERRDMTLDIGLDGTVTGNSLYNGTVTAGDRLLLSLRELHDFTVDLDQSPGFYNHADIIVGYGYRPTTVKSVEQLEALFTEPNSFRPDGTQGYVIRETPKETV